MKLLGLLLFHLMVFALGSIIPSTDKQQALSLSTEEEDVTGLGLPVVEDQNDINADATHYRHYYYPHYGYGYYPHYYYPSYPVYYGKGYYKG